MDHFFQAIDTSPVVGIILLVLISVSVALVAAEIVSFLMRRK